MTISDQAPATLPHAFAFARRQHDPAFRRYLADIGWTPDHHVVIAFDDEPIGALVDRIVFNEPPNMCLIAIPHEGAPFGFRIMLAGVKVHTMKRAWHRVTHSGYMEIKPETHVGMLWSSGTRCGEYMPSEWSRPVVFEPVKAPA